MDKNLSTRSKFFNNAWLIPLAIFIIALLVRLIGLKFSFPLLTHHDEQYIIDPLIEMSKNKTLDSGYYNRPNQVLYTILFAYLNLVSKLLFHKNFGWAYIENPLFFYFHARLILAFIGSVIPVLAWKIGKLNKWIDFSLPAAILTCFYPPFLAHSHVITGDILNTIFSLATILLCLNYLQKEQRIWLILASICVALNTVEKYPGILSYGIVLVTIVINAYKPNSQTSRLDLKYAFREILISISIVILAMFIFAPHLFYKLDQVRDILILEGRNTHLGADNLSWFGNMNFYIHVFIDNAGWIVSLFALAGILLTILSKQPAMLLLYFGAGYWVALSKLGLHWERWSLPMMITPLLLAALSIAKVWSVIKHRKIINVLAILFFVVFGFIYSLNGLTSSLVLDWQDTRVEALQFLTENGVTTENSISEGYTPFYARDVKTIFDFDFKDSGEIDYVILSSNMYGRFQSEPDRYLYQNTYYNNLRAEATLIAEFIPDKRPSNPKDQIVVLLDYLENLVRKTKTDYKTGPVIQIYQLPSD